MGQISEENIELFDSYLNDDLTPEERKSFAARISYDFNFKEEFETYIELERGIKNHYRSQLKDKLSKKDEHIENKKKENKFRPILITASGVAACITIILYLLGNGEGSESKYDKIVSDYWPTEQGLPVKMSSKGLYDEAMNAFKTESYQYSQALLSEIESDTSVYFQAIINWRQGKLNLAKEQLNSINESSSYYNEAQYRLSLIALKLNDIELSRNILIRLNSGNTEYAQQSKNILKLINTNQIH